MPSKSSAVKVISQLERSEKRVASVNFHHSAGQCCAEIQSASGYFLSSRPVSSKRGRKDRNKIYSEKCAGGGEFRADVLKIAPKLRRVFNHQR
ncbi:hypothetical protein BaRGS_00034199, partial [Batillaria attramentaria]